jgi:hypothetical protein
VVEQMQRIVEGQRQDCRGTEAGLCRGRGRIVEGQRQDCAGTEELMD